jgi:hypothetical protein
VSRVATGLIKTIFQKLSFRKSDKDKSEDIYKEK